MNAIDFLLLKVLPYVDAHLTIVGSNLDRLGVNESSKLTIVPNAPDLTPYLQDADVMVLPIFKGSGMKTKTCEAMMFGKYIIGTTEAFEGYEIDSSFASVCNSAEEFIHAINNFKPSTNFSEYSRNCYLQKYSFDVVKSEFANAFDFR